MTTENITTEEIMAMYDIKPPTTGRCCGCGCDTTNTVGDGEGDFAHICIECMGAQIDRVSGRTTWK
jgi:hypothetical protein